LKKGYQSGANLVKNENGYLLADRHNILNRLKNYFRYLLTVHGVKDVRQTDVLVSVCVCVCVCVWVSSQIVMDLNVNEGLQIILSYVILI
jgi:hypothetical protein